MDNQIRRNREYARTLTEVAEATTEVARNLVEKAEASREPGAMTKVADTFVRLVDDARRSIALAHKLERQALRLEQAKAARAAARPRPPRERDGHSVH